MMLQKMTSIESGKSYTGFIEKKSDGGVYFNYWDPEYDNGKHIQKGRWLIAYVYTFKPEF